MQRFGHRLRGRVDGEREGIDDQDKQHRVPQKTAKLLDAELDDIGNPHLNSPVS